MPARATQLLLIALVDSLTVSALLAATLVALGRFGHVETRILLTTLSLGAFSLTGLGASVRFGRGFPGLGVTGLVASVLALALVVVVIWAEVFQEELLKAFGTAAVLAVGCAFASLVLLVGTRHAAVLATVVATISSVGLLVALSLVLIWGEFHPPQGLIRLMGVATIFAVLGAVISPLLSRVLRA